MRIGVTTLVGLRRNTLSNVMNRIEILDAEIQQVRPSQWWFFRPIAIFMIVEHASPICPRQFTLTLIYSENCIRRGIQSPHPFNLHAELLNANS